jgi:hypothetical protein
VLTSAQVRFLARAKVINEFISDPGGSIDKNMWVQIDRLKDYLLWGQTTDLIIDLLKQRLG